MLSRRLEKILQNIIFCLHGVVFYFEELAFTRWFFKVKFHMILLKFIGREDGKFVKSRNILPLYMFEIYSFTYSTF